MEDTVATTETNQEPLAPEVTQSAPQQDNTTPTADADALRREKEKLEMERNMLRKKLDQTSKELEQKTQKELEEKEDYRALAERALARAEALEKEKTDNESKVAREQANADVYSEFDPKVIEVAKTAGLGVTDDSDEARNQLKAKLEAIQEKIGGTPAPSPIHNNPAPVVASEPERTQVLKKMQFDDRNIREQAIKTAVGSLDVIRAMKEQSGRTPQEI